jgi:cardiolipin synthase A/B
VSGGNGAAANPPLIQLLDGGDAAFPAIIEELERARSSVYIRSFTWRDDATGNEVGEAVLRAADRGVRVHIKKDRVAAAYEYSAGTRQSFFHKKLDPGLRFQAWFLGRVYTPAPRPPARPNALAQAILSHPNITVEHARKRFDHSKLFIFDEQRIILGSMGIGDDHRHENVEMAVMVDGAAHVRRLRQSLAGEVDFDPARPIDFLVHSRDVHPARICPMLLHRLGLVESAEHSLMILMAYLGDRRYTQALIRAVRRGVDVTLVTAAQAEVLGDLGRATCNRILRATRAPENLRIIHMPRMVHAKVVVRDHRYADIGSANFTPLSHGVYDEINIHIDDPRFASQLEATIHDHCAEGEVVGPRVRYRRLHFHVERAILAYQGRRAGRLIRTRKQLARASVVPATEPEQ